MPQKRYNLATQKDEWYYRIKESYRNLTGRVCSRVMLNVGFISEPHSSEDIRDIGKNLTFLYAHRGEQMLFDNHFENNNEFVRRKTKEFWIKSQLASAKSCI